MKWKTPKWTPFQKATLQDNHQLPDTANAIVRENDLGTYMNSRYVVTIKKAIAMPELDIPMVMLSIRALDRSARHDWRDFQRIKNELCGDECEAVELYPAESRLVDTANQYWLFVISEKFRFPFGFAERLVSESGDEVGARQRPWEPDARPTDLKYISREDIARAFAKEDA